MRQIKSRAFILEKDAQNRDEGRLFLLSEDFGFMWLTAAGLFRPGAKLAISTEPPILVLAEILPTEDFRGGRLTTVTVEKYLEQFKNSYRNRIWFSFFVYLLKNFTGESDAQKYFPLLEEVTFSAEDWSKNHERSNLAIIYFIIKLLHGEGVLPELKDCLGCDSVFSEKESSFYPLGESGLFCSDCFRKINAELVSRGNFSFEYLSLTPLTEEIPHPERDFRVNSEVRNLISEVRKSSDLKTAYAKIFLSSKINGQLILQSRNFLLYFLASLI